MENDNRRWHIGKEIPVSVLMVLILQTVGVVWWARGLTAEVGTARAEIADIKIEVKELRVEVSGGRTTPAINAANIAALEKKVITLELRLDRVQDEQIARTPFIPKRSQ